MFSPEVFVGGGNFIGFAVGGNFAVFNEDGAVTELTDVFHGMGDEDDSLVAMKAGEIIITFSLKAASPTARTSSRMRDIAAGADSNREGKADLHAGRIILSLASMKGSSSAKRTISSYMGVHVFVREAEEGAV